MLHILVLFTIELYTQVSYSQRSITWREGICGCDETWELGEEIPTTVENSKEP